MFDAIFSPGQIGGIRLRNRIVMPAMGTNFGSSNGFVTKRLIEYHRARARGGVGMNIVEITCVDTTEGKADFKQLCIDSDKDIPGLRELAYAIQKEGSKAILQLHHAGGMARSACIGRQPVSASPIKVEPFCETSRSLSAAEIQRIVTRFASAAKRAKEAGFDGVEIHAAHGYLLQQFLSRTTNKRIDAYGGSLENRAKFLLETISAIRSAVGRDYVVWCRINGTEMGGGFSIDDARQVAKWVEKVGTDAINVSAKPSVRSVYSPLGWGLPASREIKKAINIPVIAVGCLDIASGDRAIQNGDADFIAIGRPLIADPDLPSKMMNSNPEEVTPCIKCLRCFAEYILAGKDLECSVNVMVGREGEWRIEPTDRSKKVLVVGGGPAGLEAARVAAMRGHQVTLYDRYHHLGGKSLMAAKPPHKELIKALSDYLIKEISKQGVKVELKKEIEPSFIAEMAPDVVILATGAHPLIPDIPGTRGDNVVTFEAVLSEKVEVGNSVVILGGGSVGCETAHLLAENGKKVTIVEALPEIASRVPLMARIPLLGILKARGVTMITGALARENTSNGIIITTCDGETQTIEADHIVLAVGSVAEDHLVNNLRGEVPELYVVGDAAEPRYVKEAIAEGFQVGRRI